MEAFHNFYQGLSVEPNLETVKAEAVSPVPTVSGNELEQGPSRTQFK